MGRLMRRRTFMQYLTMLAVGSQTWLKSGALHAAVDEAREAADMPWPKMAYRTLGEPVLRRAVSSLVVAPHCGGAGETSCSMPRLMPA